MTVAGQVSRSFAGEAAKSDESRPMAHVTDRAHSPRWEQSRPVADGTQEWPSAPPLLSPQPRILLDQWTALPLRDDARS